MNIRKHAQKILVVIVPIFLLGYSLEFFKNFPVEVGEYFKISTQLLPLVLSFTIFVITWYAYDKSRDNHSLFMGASFLLVGVLTIYHMLSYPFMPDFITQNSLQKSAIFWGMALVVLSILLLISAYIYNGTSPHFMKKPILIVEVNLISFILLAGGLVFQRELPALVYTDGSPSAGFLYLVVISSIIIAYSAYLYVKRFREKPQNFIICLLYGFVILIFSNFSYVYSDYAGNLLKAASFYFVYLALYRSSIEMPYETMTKAEKNLRVTAEERYRNLVDNANDAIITTDLEGRLLTWNLAAQNIFGWTEEEVTGQKFSRLLIPSDKQAENEQLIHSVLIGSKVSGIESVHKKKDGSKIDVSVTVSPLKNTGNMTVGLSVVIRDITDHKRAEEIEDENMRLAISIKAKSELLPAISHDLGTPLNAMIGFSELLKQEIPGKLNEKQRQYVDNILASSKRMLDIVNDILDLGKAETGKIELIFEKVSVPETIDDVASLFRENATKRNVLFKKELDPDLDFIEADRKRFKQIMFNLISNAVKYSKQEGGTVTIITKKDHDLAKFAVEDTGIGIREEDMGKLFSAFGQLNLGIASKYGSTGLGLVVTKKLAELQDGMITVKSTYGEGSTFTFAIPLERKNNKI